MSYVMLYTPGGVLAGVAENAMDVSWELPLNDLWTASFALPAADPKNALCVPHARVTLPDATRDLGVYRLVGMPQADIGQMGGKCVYRLEHLMATLVDDVLFGYHEVGGAEMPTRDVIQYILQRQAEPVWTLGDCDFSHEYAYKWENVSLLAALKNIGELIPEEYTWVWDTAETPYKLHLKRASEAPECGITYRRNMLGITKSMDAANLVTRLYLLGYGEGINQLTVKAVNGGKPYIDADTAATWGIKSSVYADTRIEEASSLLARGRQVLNKLKDPAMGYEARAIDLAQLTGHDWDSFMPGKTVLVDDREHGLDVLARITKVSKGNSLGDPGQVTVMIATRQQDSAGGLGALADKLVTAQTFAQGATNLAMMPFQGNASPQKPIRIPLHVPKGCVRVNTVRLSWALEPFRADATGAEAGGGSSQTSSSGGGGTQTSSSGGGGTQTSGQAGSFGDTLTGLTTQVPDNTNFAYHRHAVSPHTHNMNHTHTVTLAGHTHTVQVPSHSHSVDIPSHEHPIKYGIFEGGKASAVTIKVDGVTVPDSLISGGKVDVATLLSKDADGRIKRDFDHKIEIIPNALTRIEAFVYVQFFIQSVGGGDY